MKSPAQLGQGMVVNASTSCDASPAEFLSFDSASSTNLRLIQISFDQLIDIDPTMQKQLADVDMDFPLKIDVNSWDRASLILYLNTNPILVRQSTCGYYCIAGFRNFRLAKALFSSQLGVSIFVLHRTGKLNAAVRRQLLAIEIFAAPALSSIGKGEIPYLYNLWRQLGSSASIITGNTDQSFDLAMGFDPRNKKKNGISKAK